jgi:hypothetical protein
MIPLEILVLVSILFLLLLSSILTYFIDTILLSIGLTLILSGLLFGIPAGCYYHVLLFLRRRVINQDLKKWWISPQRYHKFLPGEERRILDRWFWIGAIFFNIAILGCGLVFLGLLKAWLEN